MKNTFFISASDWTVDQTTASCALLAQANAAGLLSLALKPVAIGAKPCGDDLRSRDALRLQQAMSGDLDYEQVNPYPFSDCNSPNLAAARAGKNISASRLAGYCRGALYGRYDFALIEGVGAWGELLNPRERLAQLALELKLPVILVVGLNPGCISQALLSAGAIAADGLKLAGWVAQPGEAAGAAADGLFDCLTEQMRAPCLGRLNEQGVGVNIAALGLLRA